jgi:hypothetical protein
MDEAALQRLTKQFRELVRERLAGAPVRQVALLQYGDEPEIEPGQLLARVLIDAPAGRQERKDALHAFHDAHREAMQELRRDLGRLGEVGLLEFAAGDPADGRDGCPRIRLFAGPAAPAPAATNGALVPVMARLGPADLETVDTLITAGIAANRAEAVRWALARIRERPAYAQLRQRAREIEELKAQF